MNIRVFLGLVASALLVIVIGFWMTMQSPTSVLDSEEHSRANDDSFGAGDDEPIPTAIQTLGLALAGESDDAVLRERVDESVEDHEHAMVEDPTGDLGLYDRAPMSLVPHHVVRGWGARRAGRLPGVVGAYVIVAAEITDASLAQLARDIHAYHHDADALSVRILDSERAATYDRHSDGGAYAADHLVGWLNRNTSLGTDRIEIRGQIIESRN